MTKERVDIEQRSSTAQDASGNAGYLQGSPVYKGPERKTRRVYILEITKPLSEGKVKKIEEEVSTTTSNINVKMAEPSVEPQESVSRGSNKIVIPPIEDSEPAMEEQDAQKITIGPTEAITYTVQKDDTLQKIAKKYYGSYGEWLKIYNANKEKIKNPNLLKPGTVITIPAAQ
jgi:nucleoid-associated protein YgaU